MVQAKPRDVVKQEIADAIRQAFRGNEELALQVVGELLDELAAGISCASTGQQCPVCEEGTLHYWITRDVQLQGLNEKFRPTAVLAILQKVKDEGMLLGGVERSLGDIPTMKGFTGSFPLYICTNPECRGLVMSVLGDQPQLLPRAAA